MVIFNSYVKLPEGRSQSSATSHSNVCPLLSLTSLATSQGANAGVTVRLGTPPWPRQVQGPLQLGTVTRRREYAPPTTGRYRPTHWSKRGWKRGWTWLYRKIVDFATQARHVASCPPDVDEAQALADKSFQNHSYVFTYPIRFHITRLLLFQNPIHNQHLPVHPHYILITSSLYPLPTLGFAPHWGFVVHILFQLQKGVAHHHLHRAWDGRGAGGSGGWPLPLFRFFDQPDPTGNLAGKSIWNETILPPEVDFNCHLCRLPKYRSDTQPREMGLTDWNPQGRSQLSILSRAEDGVNWVNFMQAPRTLMMSMKNDMKKITLLRVIPTMTSIRFVTGKSSGILSDISSGILSGISSGILSGISSGILPGISSAMCSGISSGTLSGISSGILSDILSGVLSGISSGILSGRWGPAVLTELGGSQVEVQRCSLSSEGPRLRSSCAQCAQTLAVEVRQCPLRAEVGEELGKELARRKWTWKWRQRWWRRTRRRRRRRTALIKSNNPHLAGGERHNCRLKQHLCKHLRPSKFLDISNQICQIEASWLAIVSKTREGKIYL